MTTHIDPPRLQHAHMPSSKIRCTISFRHESADWSQSTSNFSSLQLRNRSLCRTVTFVMPFSFAFSLASSTARLIDIDHGHMTFGSKLCRRNTDRTIAAANIQYMCIQLSSLIAFNQDSAAVIDTCFGKNASIRLKSQLMPRSSSSMLSVCHVRTEASANNNDPTSYHSSIID